MKYLIVKDWYTTHGNHAGMVHMCKLLVEKYSSEYTMLVMPDHKSFMSVDGNWIYKIAIKVRNRLLKHDYGKLIALHFFFLIFKLKKEDEVFLLEYIEPVANQWPLAKMLRKFSKAKRYGLAHQTPTKFDYAGITPQIIKSWSDDVNKILTFGSSLTAFFVEVGIDSNKISTGFHFVDRCYYHYVKKENGHPLVVIMMGMTQRNYRMLASVVEQCDGVKWVICRGYQQQVDNFFKNFNSVTIKGYLSESELKDEMSKADVSISVMEDTVGSNVITTSMAMGLVNVVSDVGSIRDYCNNDNSILCRNTISDFVNAIIFLKDNPNKLEQMRNNAIQAAKQFDIKNVHDWFSSLRLMD